MVGIKRYYGENRLRNQAISQYLNNEEKNQEKKQLTFIAEEVMEFLNLRDLGIDTNGQKSRLCNALEEFANLTAKKIESNQHPTLVINNAECEPSRILHNHIPQQTLQRWNIPWTNDYAIATLLGWAECATIPILKKHEPYVTTESKMEFTCRLTPSIIVQSVGLIDPVFIDCAEYMDLKYLGVERRSFTIMADRVYFKGDKPRKRVATFKFKHTPWKTWDYDMENSVRDLEEGNGNLCLFMSTGLFKQIVTGCYRDKQHECVNGF